MPVKSQAQFRYAQMLAHGGAKGNVSPSKLRWAQETVSKSEGMPVSELPERAANSPRTKYPKFGRKR